MRRSNRNSFSFPDFSIRRLILQGARAARGSPPLGQRLCDVEKGNTKHERSHQSASSSKNADSLSHQSGTPSITISSTAKSSQNSDQQKLSNSTGKSQSNPDAKMECPLCYNTDIKDFFYTLFTCNHMACRICLEKYLCVEITESRTDIACPQCSEAMHPSDIQALLKVNPKLMNKYEDFMVRRVLLADPDCRWCPAPDCGYAVIATGCASCPRLRCERPGCDVNFCYHCKAEWHPDQTCDAARASRQSPTRAPSGSISQDSQHRDDIKPCPRCQVLIVKMDDGSCNHMVCTFCGSEFCWLCMKEISDLHYLSPSGCTFWGKKPWSRKKKLLWQLGTLVGAPVGIALVAGIAVPAMIIGIPVWVGRKIHTRYKLAGKHKRNCAVLGGVAASVIVSPVLAGLAVAIGVPILLFYVYGVVPVSLCRAGCGVSTSRDGVKFDFDEDPGYRNQDASSVDAVSRIGATSIGEVSLSVASGSHIGVVTQNPGFGVAHVSNSNRESTTALAGSITGHRLEVQADVSSSETASAVTCVSEKSANTLNDTASTRALAGSILSYKQQVDSLNLSEDGASERVRFDNTVCYVYESKNESDIWYTTSLDQDHCAADKASLGSGRSFRGSERSFRDDIDSTSLSSAHKRISLVQRIPKLNNSQHRNLSLDSNNDCSANIPENINLEKQAEEENANNDLQQHTPVASSSTYIMAKSMKTTVPSVQHENEVDKQVIPNTVTTTSSSNDLLNSSPKSVINNSSNNNYNNHNNNSKFQPDPVNNTINLNSRVSSNNNNLHTSMSKTTILRNLFFFQNENGNGEGSSSS